MVGVAVFLSSATQSAWKTVAQVGGQAVCMRAAAFRSHINSEARLREIMGRYTQALLAQVSQSVACNRLHGAEARCARWLLMTQDRVGADEFELTQEFLAHMIGVRRATVSEVAGALQHKGIIRCSHGRIRVLDRLALERHACECYAIIRRQYAELLEPDESG